MGPRCLPMGISNLFFPWVNSFLTLGYRRRLEVSDSKDVPVPTWLHTAPLYGQFHALWQQQIDEYKANAATSSPPQVIYALWRLFRRRWWWATSLNIVSAMLQLCGPLLLRELLQYFQESQAEEQPQEQMGLQRGILLVGLLALAQGLDAVAKPTAMFWVKQVGVGLRMVLIKAVYHSCLTLSSVGAVGVVGAKWSGSSARPTSAPACCCCRRSGEFVLFSS